MMKNAYRRIPVLGALGLFAAAAACSHDAMLTGAAGAVQASVSLKMGSGTASVVTTPFGLLADEGDSGRGGQHHGMNETGRISRSQIDSLVVDITKVEVRAELPDTENAADSAAEAKADSEKSHEDDDHENDERTWVSLDVVGNGHLNLLKLPDSASAGITIATGTLAPGVYKHVRLFATNPMIFFNAPIITSAGDTLKPGIGYPVTIPSADSTGAAIKTNERFTVPSGGGNVSLFFDADDTIRHVVLTGDGKIVVPPVIR